jgi:hypothetical protein
MMPLHHMRPRPHFGVGGQRHPAKPSDSLILRKIPRESNTITKLSGHFERFGTIVNLTVSVGRGVEKMGMGWRRWGGGGEGGEGVEKVGRGWGGGGEGGEGVEKV